MSHSYAHGYEEESHEIAVGRTRSRGHSSTAAESVKAADIDDVESISDTTTIVDERDFKHKQTFKGWVLLWLAYQSTGVIYGDIGTSPLYVYSSTFSSPPSRDDLLGSLSLIIWSMTLIVTIKYVFIVLCADDEGEGGTFAIFSLLSRYSNINTRDPKSSIHLKMERHGTNDMTTVNRGVRSFLEKSRLASIVLKLLSVLGVSLIMADGVLTPAQSVLGAVQGLEVAAPNISTGTIVGVTCAILIILFMLQPLGISKLGSTFAPIVIVWMLFNFAFGAYNLAKHDAGVLRAFSPYFAGSWFVRNKTDGWKSLGGILLAFTGVEALFADLGAFSKRAIQISWLGFCYPCLLLAYIGQAAFISDTPSAYANPFFETVPPGTFWPSLVLSVLASVVASQAIITSTFQLLVQVMNLSYFPQIKTVYTSSTFFGQVYIPLANWLLMIGTVIVTAVYNNTTRLGHAYGVCVILVTFITTCMITLVAIIVWRLNILLVLVVFIPFVTLDGLFLSSALTKVPDGAWFTLMLAVVLASIFILWRFGKEQQWTAEARDRLPTAGLIVKDAHTGKEMLHEAFGGGELTKIKGLGIFFDKAGHSVPTVYAQFLQKFEARPNVHVFLQLRALSVPFVDEGEKYTVTEVSGIENCYRVIARHGYNEQIVTKELGGVVYAQIRKYIVQSAHGDNKHPHSFTTARPENFDEHAAAVKRKERAGIEQPEAVSSSDDFGPDSPFDTKRSVFALRQLNSPHADEVTASKLTALDRAYDTQVVYIVGKEQLRIAVPERRTWSELVGFGAFRRVVLGVFIWTRENTRAKVASMRIPVEKLVEVGFVKEM